MPPLSRDVVSYADFKWNMVPTVDAPRNPTVLDTNYPVQTIWRNSITFSECILTGFDATGALWSCFTSGAGNITSLRADDGNVVMPLAGVIDVDGEIVAALTNAKPLFTEGVTANTLKLQLQAARDRTGAPANFNDAGICSFNDAHFLVDAFGYVSLIGGGAAIDTITGDDAVAVPPDGAGNLNIVGGPGVTITGDVGTNTLTVNSVLYTDQGVSTSVVADSGSFSTAAITLTLPASPNNGERCEFVATNGILTIQAAGTQVIHLGGDSSSAGGACTGSSTGDSITLIYQSSTDDWWSLSANGVWVLT